jgi:hypothetical protein
LGYRRFCSAGAIAAVCGGILIGVEQYRHTGYRRCQEALDGSQL